MCLAGGWSVCECMGSSCRLSLRVCCVFWSYIFRTDSSPWWMILRLGLWHFFLKTMVWVRTYIGQQCWYQDLWNLWHHIGDRETYISVAKATATIFPESTWLTSHLYLWPLHHPYIKKGSSDHSLSPSLIFMPLPCPFLSQEISCGTVWPGVVFLKLHKSPNNNALSPVSCLSLQRLIMVTYDAISLMAFLELKVGLFLQNPHCALVGDNLF